MDNVQESRRWKRHVAYSEELAAIAKKLQNPQVPNGKKERLRQREKDIQERLIPELVEVTYSI